MSSGRTTHWRNKHQSKRAKALRLAALPLLASAALLSCSETDPGMTGKAVTTTVAVKSASTSSSPSQEKKASSPNAKNGNQPKSTKKTVPVKKEKQCTTNVTATGKGCPPGMSRVKWFCIDRYEAHLEDSAGNIHPQNKPPGVSHGLRAVSTPCVLPQAHMTWLGAQNACEHVGKRLCTLDEFKLACEGPEKTGPRGACNTDKRSPHILKLLYPEKRMREMDGADFNDPRLVLLGNGLNIPPEGKGMGSLEDWENAGKPLSANPEWYPVTMRYLVETGTYPQCRSGYYTYDLVGNVAEHVEEDNPDAGTAVISGFEMRTITIAGGSFSDPGYEGCGFVLRGHADRHKDYSDGFRCCSRAYTP